MKYRRKKIFIDNRLQGRLIIVMVAVEVLLLSIAMVYLNYRFGTIIEDNLYSIHRSSQGDLLLSFAEQIGWVLFEIGILNAMMLFIAHYFWSQQVESVLQIFRNDLYHIRTLRLVEPEHIANPVHELLTLLEQWFSGERRRIRQMKREIEKLPIQDSYQPQERDQIRQQLAQCQQLLILHHSPSER